jgi:HEAT repeat protein
MSLLRSRKPGQISLAVEIMMDVMKGEPIAGTVDVLCNHLCDRDLGVRLTAAQCLTEFGAHSEPAIPALITALKDPHEWVRAEAAAALAAIGPKAAAAIPALEQLRNDPCYGPCGRAQEALEAIRMSAKSAVRAQIDSQ